MKGLVGILKEYFSVKGSKTVVALSLVMTLIYSVLAPRITLKISEIFAAVENGSEITWLCVDISICFIVTIITSYIKPKLMFTQRHKVYTEIHNRIADKVIDCDYTVFTEYSAGNIQSVIYIASNISTGGKLILDIISSVFEIIVTIIYIGIIDINLMWVIFIILIVSSISMKIIYNKIIELDKICDKFMDARNNEMSKIIEGFVEIRSNNTQGYHKNIIHEYNTNTLNSFIKKNDYKAIQVFIFNVIDAILTIAVVIYGIVSIKDGLNAVATVMVLITYIEHFIRPISSILNYSGDISVYSVKYERYKRFMDIENTVLDGSIKLDAFDNCISLENVSFRYDASSTVLNDVSLNIPKGTSLGICGSSGGGKSTLLKLLLRFYEVSEGTIKIDGIDIRNLSKKSLINRIGIVNQNNYIFDGTVMDNITYGISNFTETSVINACKKACIYDRIMNLPDKFNTQVGPAGWKLSGGEKQRLAIARIFLQNPDIILLDEATAALDNESESIIQESLSLFKDKTMIVVAHRLSTIKDCDNIIVVDNHTIAEKGTHSELLELKGIYYKLYKKSKHSK